MTRDEIERGLAQAQRSWEKAHPGFIRGDRCELCGRRAKPWPRTGKRRYRHKCPHGSWCVRGHRLSGWHANWPQCKACMPFARKLEELQRR